MSKQVSIAEARNNLPQLVRDSEHGVEVRITRRGKPVAVLLSLGAYEALAAGRPSFWDALTAFRASHDLAQAPDDPFEGTRDPSPGRDVWF